MSISILEAWWNETFAKKAKQKKTTLDLLGRLLNRRKGHRFTDRRMDRGVQRVIAAKRRPERLAFINRGRQQALDVALARRIA